MNWNSTGLRPLTAFLVLTLSSLTVVALSPRWISTWELGAKIFVLSILGIGALVALWSFRRMRSRMVRLASVAEALQDGDYSVRSAIEGSDALAALSASIDRAAEHIEQQFEKFHATEEHIRKMAYHDPLTELPNRRMFQDLLVREVAQAKRTESVLGVVILDLDNFKDVNDSLGHTFGDLLLMQVAKRLTNIVREDDLVARLGGDEFAILLPRARNPGDLLIVVRRLLSACRHPFQLDWREVLTSGSIGVCFYPQDGSGPEALMRNADSALYQAKHKGRNNLQLFDPSMNLIVHRRLQLEQDFRRALKSDELYLDYQPLVSLDDGRITGLEALVRWNHPEKGVIGPNTFIPLAEETGMMPSLGLLVLELACRQINAWSSLGLRPVPVSVNVSVRQLQTGDFVGSVRRVLEALNVAPGLLQFEITENIATEGARKVLEYISALKRLGAGVAIDDFGTGYSSFSYLMQYQIDTIKIDKSFIAGIPDNQESVAIVRAIISLGKNLGLKVVAEGIETQTQLEMLRRCECHIGQGFLLGRPQLPDQLKIALETGHISLSDRVPVS